MEGQAVDNFRGAMEFSQEDIEAGVELSQDGIQAGITYVVERLSIGGLTEGDRQNVVDLVKRVSQNLDVNEAVDHIRKAPSASPLAIAIADIALAASQAGSISFVGLPGGRKSAVVGAVFGAHAASVTGADPVAGAVFGAAAACSIASVENGLFNITIDEFLRGKRKTPDGEGGPPTSA